MPCRNCLKRCVGISLNRNNGQMKWNHCHVLRFKEHSVENLSVIKCQIGRTFKQAKKRYKSKVTTEKALNQKLFNARIQTHHLLPCSAIPLKMTNRILYKSFIFFFSISLLCWHVISRIFHKNVLYWKTKFQHVFHTS